MKKLDTDIPCVDTETQTSSEIPQRKPQGPKKSITSVTEGARNLFMVVGALAAFTGVKIDNGGHNCSGCSVCAPPPIARKNKDEEDDRDGNEDDKE